MEKKIDILRSLMNEQKWNEALKLAARFPRLGVERDVIKRAAECITHAAFYAQIGVDTDKAIKDGIDALKHRYSSAS